MPYRIKIHSEKQWGKDLKLISATHRKKIIESIKKLETSPWDDSLQVKRLKNCPTAEFRLRVGSYRVLVNRDDETQTAILFRVLSRGKLY